MDVTFAFLRCICTATGYNPDSMYAGFINHYMVVTPFEFRKAIPKDCIVLWGLGRVPRIGGDIGVKCGVTRARQTPMPQVDQHICLAEPSRFEKFASPMLNTVVWHCAMTNFDAGIAEIRTSNTIGAFPHSLASPT